MLYVHKTHWLVDQIEESYQFLSALKPCWVIWFTFFGATGSDSNFKYPGLRFGIDCSIRVFQSFGLCFDKILVFMQG